MKLRYTLILIASIVTLVAPTVVGLVSTQADKNRQIAAYHDDGRRYVLDPAVHEEESLVGVLAGQGSTRVELLDALADCCTGASGDSVGIIESLQSKALEVGARLGWHGTVPDSDPNHVGTARSVHVTFLESGGALVPVAVIGLDPIFVSVYEPGVGRALYRRSAFDAAATGIHLDFTPAYPVTEPAP